MGKGYITRGIGFDLELFEEITNACEDNGVSRSQFVQNASRHYLRRLKEVDVNEFLNKLDDSSFEILKNEIKKRG